MAEGFAGQVMLCWPSERNAIDELNKLVEPGQRFAPTVEHTLSDCDNCERGIWIGPQQRQLVNSPFTRARKLCMFCASTLAKVLNLDPRQVDLNPDLRHARRRTA